MTGRRELPARRRRRKDVSPSRRVRALAAFAVALAGMVCGRAVLAANALIEAARGNDARAALAALDSGIDAATAAPDGTTPLLWAVYHGNVELVSRLLAAGADVHAVNRFGASAIGEAAARGDAAVLEKLLDAGANVEWKGADGQTPLMLVARTGRVDAANVLLDRGADVNARETWREQTALMWAAAQRQPEMVAFLVSRGADVNARSTVNDFRQVTAEPRRMYRPFGGLTPLLFAAREGCVECARHLVEGGADLNLPDPKDVTPLFLAIDNFHFDTAKYLIEAGANPNRWDWWGRSPLYSAVDLNTLPHGGRADRASTDTTTSLEIIELLLAQGANPNLQLKLYAPWRHIGDDRGCDSMLTTGTTPLLRAAKTFDVDAMRALIAHGADLEIPNEGGITPLMAAAGLGSVECDARGYGPGIPHYLTPDVQLKSIAAIDLLLEAGADLHARTTSNRANARAPGRTALFGAAFWGWNDVVQKLVASGAKIDVADAQGLTAVDSALGRAGGHGRGTTIEVYEETADLLRTLCAEQAGCNLEAAVRSP